MMICDQKDSVHLDHVCVYGLVEIGRLCDSCKRTWTPKFLESLVRCHAYDSTLRD
jgi:hypothetical protein